LGELADHWQTSFQGGQTVGDRIGYGSYERPNHEQYKEYLRNRFLEAINENRDARRVLEDLHDEPFRLYLEAGLGYKVGGCTDSLDHDKQARKSARGWTQHLWNHPKWKDKFEAGPIAYDSHKESFRQSLFDWSRRSHLDAAWCRECAYNTLDLWAYSQPDREQLKFRPLVKTINFFPMGGDAKGLSRRFTFDYMVIHPQLKFLEETEAEIREAFDRQLNALLMDLKRRAKASGYVQTPETYKSKYREYYYGWLVEWAINGKPIKRIAEETIDKHADGGPDNKTVRDAVKRLAEDIELPLQLA
jgi:hypothetical protein